MSARRILIMLRREAAMLRKAPLPLLSATVFPVLAWTVIALTLQQPVIEHVPVTVLDQDGSALSRTIIRQLDATQALRIVAVTADEQMARQSMQEGESVIVVMLPPGLESDIKRGGSSACRVLANGSQLLYAKIAYRAAVTGIYTVSAGIQVRRLEAKGLRPEQAIARAVPVKTEIHAPTNSWYDYGFYLVPGMMLAILQMSASFSALWLFREHRDRDAKLIIPPSGRRVEYLLARGLPLLAANLVAVLALFLVFFPMAGVPLEAHTMLLFLRTMLFVIACLGMGAFLSASFSHLVTAAQIGLIINAPAFVFSGYTFPRWAMPDGIRVFAEVIPLTHLLDGFFPLMLYHETAVTGVLPLVAFTIVFWSGAMFLASPGGVSFRKRCGQTIRRFIAFRPTTGEAEARS